MKIGKIKIERTTVVKPGDVVIPYYVLTDSLDTGIYEDITSIEMWDSVGVRLTEDIEVVRAEIKTLSANWGGMSVVEKKIAAKYFVVDKDKRDEVLSDEEQIIFAEEYFNEKKTFENTAGKLLYNKSFDDIDSFMNSSEGYLYNYKELGLEFDGLANGSWHVITLSDEVTPNSVITISCLSTKKNKKGGVREVGSSLDRSQKISANGAFTLNVKTNENNQIEVYKQSKEVSFYISAQLS